MVASHYLHRKYTVDFHILLWKWTKKHRSELLFFDTYFDKLGNNRVGKNLKAKTKLAAGHTHLIADAIFGLQLLNNKQELYAFEVYNGKDSLWVYKKLKTHAESMAQGALNLTYNFHQPYRVLCVFQYQSTMQAVMRRMNEYDYFSYMKKHFLFKDIGSLYRQELSYNWFLLDGKSINMISKETVNTLNHQLLAHF